MTSIIGRRLCLHEQLRNQQQQNGVLKHQLDRLERLANLGTTTCMIAHEINNLLTPLGNYAAMALENAEDKALVEKALRKTASNCAQATMVMQSLLRLADGAEQQKRIVRLRRLVEEVFAGLCRDFSKDGITVDIRVPHDLELEAVAVQIQHVLINLILNAREAMLPGGGCLTIAAEHIEGNTINIEVRDTGRGIEGAALEKIFEPFFSTKTAGTGACDSKAGLGLAFCKKVITEHGGSIAVKSEPDKGTVFRISLPKKHGFPPSTGV